MHKEDTKQRLPSVLINKWKLLQLTSCSSSTLLLRQLNSPTTSLQTRQTVIKDTSIKNEKVPRIKGSKVD